MVERDDKREAALDETIEESFPASDPPANTIETGMAGSSSEQIVRDNKEKNRFELEKNGEIASLDYERTPTSVLFIHTEVPPPLRGQHIGDILTKAGLSAVRAEGLRIVATCPFVQAYLRKHPEESEANS